MRDGNSRPPDGDSGPGGDGSPARDEVPDGSADDHGTVLRGVSGSGGVAVGRVVSVDDGPTGAGHGSVADALDAAAAELAGLADALRGEGRAEQADIVEVGALIAEDPALRALAEELAGAGLTAVEAVAAATNRHADALTALGDPVFADRATDIRQIGRRAAAWLRDASREHPCDTSQSAPQAASQAPSQSAPQAASQAPSQSAPQAAPQSAPQAAASQSASHVTSREVSRETSRATSHGADIVLVGDELAAADVLMPGRGPVAAVSARGGPTGHLAVVARALGIPLVLGADVRALRGTADHRVLVDGDRGLVMVDPQVGDLVPDFALAGATENATGTTRGPAAPDHDPSKAPVRPTTTRDGRRIRVRANVGSYREAVAARTNAAEGVGLLRTELPFLAADHWPDADEHTASLVPLLRDGPEGTFVVRTLDFAGDKRPVFLGGGPGAERSDAVLRAQFRGILAAAATTGRAVRILVPMVEGAAEFVRCRHLLADVCRLSGVTRRPPLGAMVELPGAVAEAEDLAAAADFLALGTNDLTALLLGLDRDDPGLTPARTADPVVLAAVRRVAGCAHAFGRPVSVCGDAAADPRVLPLLLGLGVDALSVAPPALEAVREQVRTLDSTHCAELARERLAHTGN